MTKKLNILLTGATGYIGKRLLPVLLKEGHTVFCLVRNPDRFQLSEQMRSKVTVIKGDLLSEKSLESIPLENDVAYYLVHSMSHSAENFTSFEITSAKNFCSRIQKTQVKQIVYLSGIVNDKNLSHHLQSRLNVEKILINSGLPVTVLRAGIIIGSGSASFEILRDIVEKLPVMITPKWVNNRTQPIAIHDVIYYLQKVILNPNCLHKVFDIGGPDVMTYKEMMLKFAKVRGFKRYILTLPVLTPKISSYWLYFVTSTSFNLAQSLVDSMKNEVICHDNEIQIAIPHQCFSYEVAIERAFEKIEQNMVISSWKDAWVSGRLSDNHNEYIQVPQHGCFRDVRTQQFEGDTQKVLENIWTIGGEKGWYVMNWLWEIRGFLDKLVGGVGLRRGRTSPDQIEAGDALDFWRVMLADKKSMRLLLYAEMKLPGEAWLEFRIEPTENGGVLHQIATYRPDGVLGRLYWFSVLPFHALIFGGMIKKIAFSEN